MTPRCHALNSYLFLLLALLLVACGSQRDAEFSDDDPQEQEGGDPVPISTLFAGQFQSLGGPLTNTGGKRLEVMDNADDFFLLLDAYTDEFVPDPDFTEGQVLLYDAGWVDDNDCAQQRRLRRVNAKTLKDDPEELVQVTLEFDFSPADDTISDCTDEEIRIRPFEFIFVDSRADLMVTEQLQSSASNTSSGTDNGDANANANATISPRLNDG